MSVLKGAAYAVVVFAVVALSSAAHGQVSVLKTFPVNTLEGVIAKADVTIDKNGASSEGACLKITATKPETVRLFEVRDLNVDDCKLIYQARLRTQNATDKIYLEMWCQFSGKGEYFSRGLDRPLTGTTEWMAVETPFYLQEGQKPDLVKLNIVVLGTGTVWVEEVKLIKALLK
jgi:hypothetical protein